MLNFVPSALGIEARGAMLPEAGSATAAAARERMVTSFMLGILTALEG